MNKQTVMISATAVVLASMSLVGCNKRDDTAANTQNDTVMAQAERGARDMKSDANQGWQQTKESAQQTGQDLKNATANTSEKVGDKVADAVITTSVNAELAKDRDLSALKIDVDTSNGRVALNGVAPSQQARERATQLASSVKGVTGVDNQLVVQPPKL